MRPPPPQYGSHVCLPSERPQTATPADLAHVTAASTCALEVAKTTAAGDGSNRALRAERSELQRDPPGKLASSAAAWRHGPSWSVAGLVGLYESSTIGGRVGGDGGDGHSAQAPQPVQEQSSSQGLVLLSQCPLHVAGGRGEGEGEGADTGT